MRPMLSVRDFIILMIGNTIFAVCYLIYGLLRYRVNKGGEHEMEVGTPESVLIKTFAMHVCPVVMPLF